ncbi:MAG TPA: hypothetical protein VMU79_02800 [Casimicrobiaceae bacterium]|jgi:hypothetical protein|nr:hypothetical protein [Casimicrobiaceae bacterium]
MSFLTRIVVFWMFVIAAISMLRLFPDSLPARLAFARLGPLPRRDESTSGYLLRWAGFWGSWVAQCALVATVCWFLSSKIPALAESLWFPALWIVVVPTLAVIASLSALAVLAAAAKARFLGPDPVYLRVPETAEAEASLER